MKRVHSVLVGSVAALSLALTACGTKTATNDPGKAVSYGPGNTAIFARSIGDAVSLDPGVAYEFASVSSAHNLYSNLVTYAKGDATNPVAQVAEKWEMSPDGLTWTFHLKKGIKFASGNELTADDVVYSLKRVVNIPKDPAAWLITDNMGIDDKNFDQQVKAIDPATVQIKLAKPFAPGAFLSIMTFPTTAIVDSKVVKQHEENGDWAAKWLTDHSAGSGPYTLDRWERDSQIVLNANPGYNLGPAPAMKRIMIKHVAENTAQLDQLKRGDVDMAMSLNAEQLKTLKGDAQYTIQQSPDLSLAYLGLDVKNVPAFAKPEVRQAIKYAIDYKGIIDHLLSGNGLPTQGIIPKGVYGYNADAPYSQNIDKAKALLAQAGFGSGFTVELLISNAVGAGGVAPADVASEIKADLAKIGITVNVRQITYAELLKTYRAQKAQMVLANWSVDYPDPDDFAKPLADYATKSLAWRLQWDDQELGQLVEKAGTLPNGDERAKLYQQITKIELDRSPFAILYQPLVSLAGSSKLQNVEFNPIWGIEFADLTKK